MSKPHVSTWHRGEACGFLTTADIQQYFPKAWERLAVTLTRFVKTNAAQSWLTGCEQLGWGLQRPRAPLLEAAFVSQAPRGRAASLQMPFSRGPRALLCLEWDTEAGRGAPYHKQVFPM